jgi:hypothetical protein
MRNRTGHSLTKQREDSRTAKLRADRLERIVNTPEISRRKKRGLGLAASVERKSSRRLTAVGYDDDLRRGSNDSVADMSPTRDKRKANDKDGTTALISRFCELCDCMNVDDLVLEYTSTMSNASNGGADKRNARRAMWNVMETRIHVRDTTDDREMFLSPGQIKGMCPMLEEEVRRLYGAMDKRGM